MKRRLSMPATVLLILTATSVWAQDNWPQFRGESAGVVADNPALPERWGPDENIAWEIAMPGRGWA